MGKYFLVGWLPGLEEWFARQRGGQYFTSTQLDEVMRQVRACRMPVMIDRALPARDVLVVTGACAFLGITVINESGEVVKPTPVLDAKVIYLTRKELGRLLPDGWMIEVQLNRYMPCFGETLSLPARKGLAQAITDIQVHLAKSIETTAQDLAESVAATPTLGQVVMDLGLASSDSRGGGAGDTVTRT